MSAFVALFRRGRLVCFRGTHFHQLSNEKSKTCFVCLLQYKSGAEALDTKLDTDLRGCSTSGLRNLASSCSGSDSSEQSR